MTMVQILTKEKLEKAVNLWSDVKVVFEKVEIR